MALLRARGDTGGRDPRARVALENAGSATWRSRGRSGVRLAYHWLDPLGNPIVWDGTRTAFPGAVAPGETVELDVTVTAPRPPGGYVLSFDLVEEYRFWFGELGSTTLDIPVEVAPRIAERRLKVVVKGEPDAETAAALRRRRSLCGARRGRARVSRRRRVPAPDWSRRLLDAHAEGWAAVGGAVAPVSRRDRRELAPWAPSGRNPRFEHPLLFPSLLDDLEPGERADYPPMTAATSSSTAGLSSDFDRDPVVHPREDERPETERRAGGDTR